MTLNNIQKIKLCQSEILDRMYEMGNHLSLLTVQILSASQPGSLANLLANISYYANKQLSRIRDAYKCGPLKEIDRIAWSTTCLMETQLLLDYIVKIENEDALKIINEEFNHDNNIINLGMHKNIKVEHAESMNEILFNFSCTSFLEKIIKKSCLSKDLIMHRKFLYKYSHPSVYFLFKNFDDLQLNEHLLMILEKTNEYLSNICDALNYVLDSLA